MLDVVKPYSSLGSRSWGQRCRGADPTVVAVGCTVVAAGCTVGAADSSAENRSPSKQCSPGCMLWRCVSCEYEWAKFICTYSCLGCNHIGRHLGCLDSLGCTQIERRSGSTAENSAVDLNSSALLSGDSGFAVVESKTSK